MFLNVLRLTTFQKHDELNGEECGVYWLVTSSLLWLMQNPTYRFTSCVDWTGLCLSTQHTVTDLTADESSYHTVSRSTLIDHDL